jgi:hypothetical protein
MDRLLELSFRLSDKAPGKHAGDGGYPNNAGCKRQNRTPEEKRLAQAFDRALGVETVTCLMGQAFARA